MLFKIKGHSYQLRALFTGKTLAFFTLLAAAAGCTTETEIVLPAVTPKLVVSSFISPEAPRVEVSVTKSAPLVSPENDGQMNVVTNATVWLSDGVDSVQLAYQDSSLYTTRAFPILPGKRYSLRVTTPEGYATHAQCTVPATINQSLTGRIDSAVTGPQTPEGNYALELRWQDLPGEGNFYRVEGITETKTGGQTGTMIRHASISFIDEPQVKDAGADGRTWQLTTDLIADYRLNQRNGSLRKVRGYLYTTDYAYFAFHRSLYNYQLSNNFSDPVKIYSNVTGGLGVFGAYRLHAIEVPIR